MYFVLPSSLNSTEIGIGPRSHTYIHPQDIRCRTNIPNTPRTDHGIHHFFCFFWAIFCFFLGLDVLTFRNSDTRVKLKIAFFARF